ncbi:conserved hypothetical protein [Cupriavidus taiwanensis]|nr:conserved hypothetical protein [Cupriavidus taiwanensis]
MEGNPTTVGFWQRIDEGLLKNKFAPVRHVATNAGFCENRPT